MVSTTRRLGLKIRTGSSSAIGRSFTDPKSMVVHESAKSEEGDADAQSSEAGLPFVFVLVRGSGEEPGKKTDGEKPSLIVGNSRGAKQALKGTSATFRSGRVPGAKRDETLFLLSMLDQDTMGLGGRSLSPARGGKLSGIFTSVALSATSSRVENMDPPLALHWPYIPPLVSESDTPCEDSISTVVSASRLAIGQGVISPAARHSDDMGSS